MKSVLRFPVLVLWLAFQSMYLFAQIDTAVSKPGALIHANKRIVLSGTVKDAHTGEPISGATIYSPEARSGTLTDKSGSFTLSLKAGKHQVSCTALGYGKETKEITATQDAGLHFGMYKLSAQLSEVRVSGGRRADANISSPQGGVTQMDMGRIQQLPAFLGEADIIKSIQLLPGVSSVGEAATGFNVRGGSTGQNLVLLDGAPLFNSSHLFGFFSVFNPNAIKEMTLYRGGIPAQYGGRIASVLEVKQKEGNLKTFSGAGGIGIVAGRLALEGPIIKDKTSFLLAGRSSYSNWLLRKMPDITIRNSRATFYDVSAKISHAFNAGNKLGLSFYSSSDDFGFTRDTLYQWVSTTASLKYSHIFHHNLILDVSGAYSKYDFKVLNETPHNASEYQNGVLYKHIKADLLNTRQQHQLHYGASLNWYDLNQGSLKPGSAASPILPIRLSPEYSLESAVYVNHEWEASPRITLMYGIRYSLFSNHGAGSVYQYQAGVPKKARTITDTLHFETGALIQAYQGIEPRFSLKYSLDENSSLKLGYNRNRQYLHLISNTTAVSPTDFWKSSNRHIEPQLGDQLSLGYFRNFNQHIFEASVEGYYKYLQQVLDYKNGANLFLNQTIEADLLPGTGRAYGVEASLQKRTGRLTGWFSYAYARTLVAVKGNTPEETINGGAWYPASFDKPHTLNMISRYQIKKRLSWSANFTFSTGRPITAPLSQYVIGQYVVPNFGDRNQYRIPDYHRLDLSLAIEGKSDKKKKWEGSWNISVYNVYGRKNPYSVFFKQVPGAPPKAYQLAVVGVPLPSISYDFKF